MYIHVSGVFLNVSVFTGFLLSGLLAVRIEGEDSGYSGFYFNLVPSPWTSREADVGNIFPIINIYIRLHELYVDVKKIVTTPINY